MLKLASVFLLSPLLIYSAEEPLPKADAILDRVIEVTGGKAAWEKRQNLVRRGTVDFIGNKVKGSITIYEATPNRVLAVLEIPGIGKIESGSNGEVAWENSPGGGPRIKDGPEKVDALRDGTFNAPLFWRKLYSKVETLGTETVQGHDTYKVQLTPESGEPTTEYLDKKTGLLVKTSAARMTPKGRVSGEILYEDYRKEGDVLVPFKLTNRFAGQEFQIQIQSAEVNVNMPPDRFNLPPEVQFLLRKSATVTPDTNGKLTIFMAGNQIATENYTLRRGDGKIEIDGSGVAMIGPMKVDIDQFKVLTNDQFEPLEADARGKLGQIQMNVRTTFSAGKAVNSIDTGQGPRMKEDPVHPGALVVNMNLPLYPWTLLALRADLKTTDPQQYPVYVIGHGETTATLIAKGRETVQFAGKTAQLNHLNVTGALAQQAPIAVDFWIDDDRKLVKVVVPSQGVEAYQEGFDREAAAESASR